MVTLIEAEGYKNVVNAASFKRVHLQRMSRETLEDLQKTVDREAKRDPNRNPISEFSLPQMDFLEYMYNCAIVDANKGKVKADQLATTDKVLSSIAMAVMAQRVIERYHIDIQRTPSNVVLTDRQLNPPLSLLLRQIIKMRIQVGRPV